MSGAFRVGGDSRWVRVERSDTMVWNLSTKEAEQLCDALYHYLNPPVPTFDELVVAQANVIRGAKITGRFQDGPTHYVQCEFREVELSQPMEATFESCDFESCILVDGVLGVADRFRRCAFTGTWSPG